MSKNILEKLFFHLVRFIVGVLFIFSGLIKLNDPVGTQIKLEEYFNVFATDFGSIFAYFIPFALSLSVFLCVIEVVLGFTLLFSAYLRFTINALIVIIVFFTILTGYSAITNKVTDCGCFGDAIKLTPWESFFKDIFLGICIYILFLFQPKNSKTVFWQHISTGLITLASLVIALMAINYLPFIDFRAYEVGENINAKMKPSEPYKYEYHMISPSGEKNIYKNYPSLEGYKLDTMIHLNPKAKPLITDFALWDDVEDKTDKILQGEHIIITIQKVDKISKEEWSSIEKELFLLATNINTTAWHIVTSSDSKLVEKLLNNNQLKEIPIIYADATVLKAVIRSNIGLVVFKDGIVKGKWHSNALPTAEVLKSVL